MQSQSSENKGELLGSGKICEISDYNNTALSGIKTQQQISACKKNSEGKGLVLADTEFTPASAGKKSIASGNYEYQMMEDFRKAFGLPTGSNQGKVIITATSGHEESLFDPDIFSNSYFTYYLVKGLKHSRGQIFPAFDYAQLRTRKLVSDTESCRTQTPEMVSTPDACINIDLSK